jgi:hypothetical protein
MYDRTLLPALLAAVALCSPVRIAAQDSTRTPPRLCFRGRPEPHCQRFVLTEVGYYAHAAGSRQTFTNSVTLDDGSQHTYSRTENDVGSHLAFELGLMANRGPRAALGATLLLEVGHGGPDVGIKGRYRRWLTPNGTALDVGAGVISGSSYQGGGGDANGHGVTADVALNASDYGAIVLRMDALRVGGRTTSAVYGGVRLGSLPALIGTGILAVGVVALLLALAGGID